MPLELEIVSHRNPPFGTVHEVRSMIREVLPSVEFWRTPSGPEKLKLAAEQGVEFTGVLREHLESAEPTEEGLYEGDGFSLEYHFGCEDPIQAIYLDVRGSGNAIPVLSKLAQRTGWKIVRIGTVEEVTSKDWRDFRAWTAKAVKIIKGR